MSRNSLVGQEMNVLFREYQRISENSENFREFCRVHFVAAVLPIHVESENLFIHDFLFDKIVKERHSSCDA